MRLICVGKVKEQYIKAGLIEYEKKINFFEKFEIVRIKDSNMKEEGKEIIEKAGGDFVIVLGEEGKQFSSVEFSEMIKKINKNITFVIGSCEGLSEEVKRRANLILSLSKMTFLHEMAQLFLAEQLYRHCMIKNNRSYHR